MRDKPEARVDWKRSYYAEADQSDALRKECERLRDDAGRYRWLRATTNFATNSAGERIDVRNKPDLWDATIDAARKEQV